MFYVTLACCMVLTYFICGIPFGKLIGVHQGKDVTQQGSKSTGATNVRRVCGSLPGVITLLLDMAKGWLSLTCSLLVIASLAGDTLTLEMLYPPASYCWVSALLYMSAILGHVYSPYLHFKGGKGIAVGFGAALAFSYPLALGLLVIWALTFVPSNYVSVGSICAAACLPPLAFFLYYPPSLGFELPLIICAVVVLCAHRENIKRLKAGNESPAFARRK